jgi:hypothetical protein
MNEGNALLIEESDYLIDYAYELKRIGAALIKLSEKKDDNSIKNKIKLAQLYIRLSLRTKEVELNLDEKKPFYAIAAKNNADHLYEEGNYSMYADEISKLDKYLNDEMIETKTK